MKLCRHLVTALLATATSVGVFAQPAGQQADALRFANGIVAVAEDKIITVADVMREVSQYLPGIQERVRSSGGGDKEYAAQVEELYDSTIQGLIDRVLIIKEFRKDDKRQIPISYIDNAFDDDIADRFEGDRSKFLAYLRSQGKTQRDYRRELEENIIYQYMQGQQRKSQSVVSPVRIETFYNENKDQFYQDDQVHIRMIQLARVDGATDASLTQRATELMNRFKAGEKFEELAKEYSDLGRSKGGDLGWLKKADFRDELRDPAMALKKGEIVANPILLPEGAFIIYAEDRKFAGIRPIDEVRDQIERILISQMSNAGHERWLERLRRNGYVKHY